MVPKNLFAGQQWRNKHKQTYVHRERGGEGKMYRESNVETYINIYKIDTQWEFAVCLRELKQGVCINLDIDGERDGREVLGGGVHICIPMIDSC